jgi:hypothetical protein
VEFILMASATVLRRFVAMAALAILALAIGLGRGRLEPDPEGHRFPAAPRYHLMRASVLVTPEHRLLDAEIGCLVAIPLPRDDYLFDAASSPWRDSWGHSQMVGRWARWRGQADECAPQESGLLRFRVPDGEVLEHIQLDLFPYPCPCWFPGPAARVLFATGDGRLHRLDFDAGPGVRAGRSGSPRRTQHLPWPATMSARDSLRISDLSWPEDPRLGGRIIATIIISGGPGVRAEHVGQHLWWLRLDREATAIEAVGCVITPAPAGAPESAEENRLPALATPPDRTLVLAYLSRPPGHFFWQLRLAPVAIDAVSGAPRVDRATSQLVARQCAPSVPVFSPDGHWVYVVLDRGNAPAQVVRYEVAAALAGRSSSAVVTDE